jgi:hypothetical protein
MIDAANDQEIVRHAGFAPGEFPARWHDRAHELHGVAWPTAWEGQLDRDRFIAEMNADHVDVLCDARCEDEPESLLAYVKWKATEKFQLHRDALSDPARPSLATGPPAGYVCAYEITATTDGSWRGLGRRLLTETIGRWDETHAEAVYCTYSPKRGLTAALRQLATTEQYGRPALEAFAHRAAAVASRRIDRWIERLEQPLERFIRDEIVPVPDNHIMPHLAALGERYGRDVIDGVTAAIGIAYNFVLRAKSGLPACGPAAFHRAVGAEHWRQYPASALNCADALGLVDHWRYSHDPARRQRCADLFREQRKRHAQGDVEADRLLVLA